MTRPAPHARLLAGLAATAGGGGAASRGEAPAPQRLGLRLAPSAADPLRSYAWDGGPEVPLHRAPPELEIEYGELGRTADTLLYLPFDEGVAGALFLPELGVPVEHARCTWTRGRFGTALELAAPGSRAVLRPGAVLPDDAWTVQLWVRPERGWGRILELPGRLYLGTTRNRRLRVEVSGRLAGDLVSLRALERGGWNSIGLALSAAPLPQLRLVLNGVPQGATLSPGAAGAEPGELLLGGAPAAEGAFRGALDELRIRGHAASSAELAEQGAPSPTDGLHALELRRASGVERLELWSGVPHAALVEGEGLAAGDLEHAALRDGRLRWVPGQWTRLRPERPPPARTTHPTVYVGARRVLVFGGETRDTDLPPMVNTDDTWLFHTDTASWERVATDIAPSPRCHQAAAYSPDHGLLLLIGGFRNDGGKYEIARDAWIYDVARREWRPIHPRGYPGHPSGNNALVYSSELRAFLQINARGVACWLPDQDQWIHLPGPRVVDARGAELADFDWPESPTCGLVPGTGELLLFGGTQVGASGTEFFDHTYLYDLRANTLTLLDCPEAPSPRVRPGFAWDSRRGYFVLFGGVQEEDSERQGDLWRFLPQARAWQRLDSADPPSRRGGYYGMAYDPEADAFFLLCGRHDLVTFLNESWQLHLDERAVGRATYVFARAALPEHARWTLRADEPGDARVEVRFRCGSEGVWSAWRSSHDEARAEPGALVMVELALHPGTQGEVPEVLALGFVAGD